MPAIYHFTHVENLVRIVGQGEVRCHAAAAAVVDIADPSIKNRRSRIQVPCGPRGVVGDYVPFYFAPRSPMLFRIHRGGVEGYTQGQSPLVYLRSTTERIVAAGLRSVFTDGNAATAITGFYDDLSLLDDVVDWPLMGARYWSNTPEDGDRVRRRQAEFLVYGSVPLELIDSLAVVDAAVRSRVQLILNQARRDLPVHVRAGWYFDS